MPSKPLPPTPVVTPIPGGPSQFAGLSLAPRPYGKIYLREGHHRLRLVALRRGLSAQGKGRFAAAEWTVVQSDGPEPHAVGETASQVLMLDAHGQAAYGRLAGIFDALLGYGEWSDEDAEQAFAGDGQSLAGIEVWATGTPTTTRAGRDIVQILYAPIEQGPAGPTATEPTAAGPTAAGPTATRPGPILSDDGQYEWDGSQWQPVTAGSDDEIPF